MKSNRLFFFSLVGLIACVKPYDFDTQNFEKLLVIDGLITDQEGPFAVRINYSYPLDTSLTEFVNSADVWIEDGDGVRTEYNLSENGTYYSPPGFSASVGQSYRLFIELEDGTSYSSQEETLIPAPDIDSIYQKYAELPNSDEIANTGGIQFFVDTHDDSGQARFFRYEWEDAYQITLPYPQAYVLGDSTIEPLEEVISKCYGGQKSTKLIYATSTGSSQNRVAEFPVRFVSEEGLELFNRYSLLVKQFAISESAYFFYKSLRENNESGGSLFDKQTGPIFGNISSIDNDQPVLGYFEVSSMVEKRRYFKSAEFDERLQISNPFICNTFTVTSVDEVLQAIDSLGDLYIYNYSFGMPASIGLQTNPYCSKCITPTSSNRPDFWVD